MYVRLRAASVTVLVLLSALPVQAAAPDTASYARVLAAAVEGGKVDYAKVRAQRAGLDSYLKAVSTTDEKALGADAKAFYINAYNATVLMEVATLTEKPGFKSVLDVKGFFDAQTHKIAGKDMTLNALEETKLRKAFGDPRIHFAVNCASTSCPVLRSQPYASQDLNNVLNAVTAAYLGSTHGMRTAQNGQLSVSKLFEWYQGDFGGPDGVRAFLIQHAPQAQKERLAKGPLGFHEYDWSLNAK